MGSASGSWHARSAAVCCLLAALAVTAAPARAEHLVLPAVAAEPDVADEAGAVTLLIRSALAREPGAIVAPTGPITMSTAGAAATKLGADHVVLAQLAREGTGLRVTLVIVDRAGTADVSFVRAGDGDVVALASGVVEKVAAVTRLSVTPVPPVALGRLRPYAAARRARATDPAAAAALLEDAIPSTATAVDAIPLAFSALATSSLPPALELIAARATAADDAVTSLGTGSDAIAVAARVLGAIDGHHLDVAQQELGTKPPKDAFVLYALAVLAEHRGDTVRLNQALREGLASERARSVLALASSLAPSRLTPEVARALLGIAANDPKVSVGVASRIGFAAAMLNVDLDRALSQISVRELDDIQLAQLAPLLQGEPTADRLRLRAELGMRRADGTEPIAIDAYLAAAPGDALAHRYKGWMLLADGHPAEAAAHLGAAGAHDEEARAQLAANDFAAARTAIRSEPTTPDELAVVARLQLSSHDAAAAAKTIGLAEQDAPVDPIVQRIVLDLSIASHDDTRAAVARSVVERGEPAVTTTSLDATVRALGSGGSGGSATTTALAPADAASGSEAVALQVTNDLHVLLAKLDQLSQLKSRHLVLAELAWHQPLLSLRVPHPELVKPYLVRALTAAPLGLRVDVDTTSVDDATLLDATLLAKATGEADALLMYRVEPSAKGPTLTLVVYVRGATEVHQVTGPIEIDGLVVYQWTRLLPLAIVAALLLLFGIYRVWRGTGHIKLVIDRPPDATDEIFHVEITTRSSRPSVGDMEKLRTATKAKGATKSSRGAGFVASGESFHVPPGTWFVHLWGSYARGGVLRPVPDSATVRLDIKRGKSERAVFDLVGKHADIVIAIQGDGRRTEVWADGDEGTKVFIDGTGNAVVPLAIGAHVLHFNSAGHQFTRDVQVVTTRMQRIAINIARERRLGEAGELALDVPPSKAVPERQDSTLVDDASVEQEMARMTPRPTQRPETDAVDKAPTLPFTAGHGATASAAAESAPVLVVAPPGPPRRSAVLLGRYRIIEELGRGAMGVVHRATDEKLEREVAIKEMSEELRSHSDALVMFTREAKALAQLNHSNIVSMYDQVEDGGKVYMIMEYVDGMSLEKLLKARGALAWRDAIVVVDQLLAGLAYAHARKIIHRDIKPANIFIARDRTVKLGDFGLARVMRDVSIRRTELRGTPLYMAPEQIAGQNVDHRADLYAVGGMLFELLCGRPPFIDGEILYHQMNTSAPSARAFVPDLPEPLEQLIVALLAKSPDDRPSSANEIRTVFKALYRDTSR